MTVKDNTIINITNIYTIKNIKTSGTIIKSQREYMRSFQILTDLLNFWLLKPVQLSFFFSWNIMIHLVPGECL